MKSEISSLIKEEITLYKTSIRLSSSDMTLIINLWYTLPIDWTLGRVYLHSPTESNSPSGILKCSIISSETCSNDRQWFTSARIKCSL